ncbi:sporulation protein YunB [[Clostridium] sordellii]|uniref:Sporulation protein YunB n=1 Tax=Paraclostridium sordellii TaxID=1505 RepID=A0ABM9RSE0_PARSO|nr:sporulation protein YunB [Paeniclostridium sordellii]CEJ74977.1 putative sporulation protein YunB [[Clostridium] sordellii] [Paeniclostridium sordellii]CEN70745.1 sporulation protein YunB [[Clostridium] sordellii] [Paeniclostridium sordellii]CEN74113.1 sporulation protein YunB [[Clostridium] sordellii] [Paeniclostridium sordellii]CEO29977.1 sporulation protein YunB [[Clostridium] sordellii] [Paeniclostridium sordellii]CEP65693.1 sporulation protein YunB [[Clostridium] sordellii] [Paeniclost
MKNILRKKRKERFKKNLSIFLMIFILSVFIGSFIYIDNKLRPTITLIAETKAEELANKSINKAVATVIDNNIKYEDLINIKTGEDGTITMMQANSILINDIASKVALEIQSEMKKIKTTSTYIPIGTAIGSPLLAKYGPKIKVSIEPIGTVYVDFGTDFESSGINQTRHRIYLKAKTEVKVVVPLTTSTKEVNTQIPICETIIVGDVPESYVNVPQKDMLNVLPNKDLNTKIDKK